MSTPTWPTTLHHLAERGSFRLSPGDPSLRSDFDYGPARMRRRFTRPIAKEQFSLILDQGDFEVFKTFFNDSLSFGTRWFTMPVWTGTAYVTHLVRFVEPYQAADAGFRRTKISANLEIKQLRVLSPGAAEIFGEYGIEPVLELANIVDYTVNTHWETTWT